MPSAIDETMGLSTYCLSYQQGIPLPIVCEVMEDRQGCRRCEAGCVCLNTVNIVRGASGYVIWI